MTNGTPTHSTTLAEKDGLGDWRIQAATRIAADIPAAFPGGPSHKAGAPIYLSTMAATAQYPLLSFITPSAAALALNAGFRSSERAISLFSQVKYHQIASPEGPAVSVGRDESGILFDYFEEALAAANSSFQAIEALANETIARVLKGTIGVRRKASTKQMSAEEVERQVSTSEKIATILPTLLNIPSIKGTLEWQLFEDLKHVRDASTHFKSGDQYPLGGGKVTKDSLYYVLLNTDIRSFPLTAVRVISRATGSHRPRWLIHLAEKYGIAQ